MYRELAYWTDRGLVRRFVPEERYAQALHRLPIRGVFASAFWYERLTEGPHGRPIPEGALRGDLYFDLDTSRENLRERWQAVARGARELVRWLSTYLGAPDQGIRLYFSGSRGIHVLVTREVLGDPAHPWLHRAYRRIAEQAQSYLAGIGCAVKLDPIYDKRRLFRLPNTVHERSGLYKVRLSPEQLDLALEGILEWASRPREDPEPRGLLAASQSGRIAILHALQAMERRAARHASRISRPFTTRVPCIAELLQAQIREGSRNVACAVLASHFLQQGTSLEEAAERLLAWNVQHCTPPLPDSEVLSVVRSIYAHGYTYGCTSLQQLDSCRPEACPIYRARVTRRRVCL